MHKLRFKNNLNELERLHSFIVNECTAVGADEMQTDMINLALEEVIVNVINYAYPENEEGDIELRCTKRDNTLVFTLIDSGTPFDPTAASDVDVTLSAEERPIGGLGIHMAKTIMDKMTYRQRDGKNFLTLSKQISPIID